MLSFLLSVALQNPSAPSRTEVINPLRNATLTKDGKAKVRKQGGNPRTVNGMLLFDGSTDGNRQVDPQIAVGGGYVLHGTNSGIVVYDKNGNWLAGVPQSEFNNGIDPKLLFDNHNKIFAFDLWNPWDEEKKKPVNISVSESSNPLAAWNTYPVPAPNGVDGGAIGFSRRWMGYSFPGGEERTFVTKTEEVKAGKPATVYHFKGSLGHPVNVLDPMDDLFFVNLTNTNIEITRVGETSGKTPYIVSKVSVPHQFKNFGWPPQSPMKGTDKLTASGDRNPKNLVITNGHLYFSQTVNIDGRAGIQFHQYKLDGSRVRTGTLSSTTSSYIQTTMAVNKRGWMLIGFQETGPNQYISARAALIEPRDIFCERPRIFKLAEGLEATEGGAWGDYSGTVVDGDNFSDLWTIQSYANSKGRGSTVIARIQPK